MRLLNAKTHKLESYDDEQSVPDGYAILSHTWGGEDQEISFEDFKEFRRGLAPSSSSSSPSSEDVRAARQTLPKSKSPGWAKIDGTCDKALEYGYSYVWIDTFCIDKSSSAELQESINSMFRWYEKAGVCFAYLSDVSSPDGAEEEVSDFRKSKWFTRGWTLQELLAPSSLDFFDESWRKIGVKSNLSAIIHEVTGINSQYIIGVPMSNGLSVYQCLSRASVAERMSWAARRRTTRPEDLAYCLLGIFDIHIPMLYGEGLHAFQRLQEEIMKVTDDTSLFAWGLGRMWNSSESSSILAPAPEYFEHCSDIEIMDLVDFKRPSFHMSQQGLVVDLPIVQDSKFDNISYLILHCGIATDSDQKVSLVAVPIVSTRAAESHREWDADGNFIRPIWCTPMLISTTFLDDATTARALIVRSSPANDHLWTIPISLKAPEEMGKNAQWRLLGLYPPQPTKQGGCLVSLYKFPYVARASSRQVHLVQLSAPTPETPTQPSRDLKFTTPPKDGMVSLHIDTDLGAFLLLLNYQIGGPRQMKSGGAVLSFGYWSSLKSMSCRLFPCSMDKDAESVQKIVARMSLMSEGVGEIPSLDVDGDEYRARFAIGSRGYLDVFWETTPVRQEARRQGRTGDQIHRISVVEIFVTKGEVKSLPVV
ncbi:hypothetical protein Daus18300_010777 [Diaporthe australafricana]|uniref:Heterokaryon incompatibility domain-containing protein n=1 Tax=Diaporthe australafricana TaxID=127596 RepID=A0ABR3W944_9PEZI